MGICNNIKSFSHELSNKYKEILKGLIAIHESEHIYKGRYSDRGVSEDKIENLKMIGLKPTKKIDLMNGNLKCSFREFKIYEGSKKNKLKID